MSLARRLGSAVAAVLVLSVGSAAVADDDAWITIERGAALRAQAGLAAAGLPAGLVVVDWGSAESLSLAARDTDVVVARVESRAFDVLPEILHQVLRRCGGFVWHPDQLEAEAAAARANNRYVLRVPEPPIEYTIDNGPVVQALLAPMTEVSVRNTITTLGAFLNRYHNCVSGANSAQWIRDTWLGMAAGRTDVTVEYFSHTGYTTQQPSVILTIQGATLPNDVVVLGAHQDSVGSTCTTRPGEDDDASGIGNITEVIRRALTMGGGGYRPERTVKFMAYAAEEVGLRGSAQIAQAFVNQGINVVGVLQLDMTAYKGSSGDIYIFTDSYTNPAQNTFLGDLVDAYLPGLVRGTSQCGYACSDHASWGTRGYPASLPFEATMGGINPWYHTASDTLAQCCGGNASHSLKFARLAGAYMAEVAKGGFTANQAPLANAGADHMASPLYTLLDGRASSDPDGGPGPVTYSWAQISGPRVTIQDAQGALARFRAPHLRSTYVFRLTVSDGFSTATDDVTIAPRTEP
jgi:leucyl aminopeptidase